MRQFRSPLVYVLLAALVLDLGIWLGSRAGRLPFDAVAIGVILCLNAGLGAWQERKAEHALDRLRELAGPRAWVLRDGELTQLPVPQLVPEDLVRLEMGDRVPADGVTFLAENLLLDQSLLTGESLPVERHEGEELHAGTLVVRGRTYLQVTRTGTASTMGRLATALGQVKAELTPLERRLQVFGRQVTRWVLILAVVVALGGVLVEGLERSAQVFLFAVALAVAVVPEGLPAVLTLTLALGVARMARRRAVVRRLAAVEALGSVTVIVTDKTGTVTENRMVVRQLDSPDRARALEALVLANDAEAETGAGDPLDVALLEYARGAGLYPEAVRADAPRESSRSFDSAWKYMRATVARGDALVSYVKGAPEVVLERCVLADLERHAWESKVQAFGAEGFRILGLAWGPGEREQDLHWLGLALLWDPPRPEVPEAVAQARAAGIRVVLVTGDHPATALTVARSIGLGDGTLVTGAELDRLSPDRLRDLVRDAAVFARAAPEHKLRIVEALQANGEIVAMTGDGVNDAPALKRADVGVAMGRRGSAVSREVADLVLLDDNFATIVAAVEEGRGIYENIQRFLRFLFSTNLSEVLVVGLGFFIALLAGLRDAGGALLLPLTAAQLLWINLVTDGAPALALGVDRSPGVMRRAPRDPASPLLDSKSLRFVLLSGAGKALLAFLLLALLPRAGESIEGTRTATFMFMAVGQLFFAYPARRSDLLSGSNPLLHAAVAVGLLAQAAVLGFAPLRSAFQIVPLSLCAWGAVIAAVLLAWGLAELSRRVIWGGRRAGAPPPASAGSPLRRRNAGRTTA